MRGKYITTSLRLAVLAGTKKAKYQNVVNPNAPVKSFNVVWSKENTSNETKRIQKDDRPMAYAV